MKIAAGAGFDDHPDDDQDRPRTAWVVNALDDCDGCGDLRVEVILEPEGANGTGVAAHLSPDGTRRLRVALASALKQIDEPAD